MPPRDDNFDYESIVEACARGDRLALRSLYDREARRLLGVALRIVRNRETAHDVLQEAFLQIWQRASTYQRALGSARGWVYTVVRHRALDTLRSHREVPLGDDLESLADRLQPVPGPDHAADARALGRCLETLDEQKRNCIVSAFVEGYTHDQIAARQALPVGTVKTWIRRGLLSLRECLS